MPELVYRVLGGNVQRPPAAGEKYKRTPADVLKMLLGLIAAMNPHALLLMEVSRYHDVLRKIPGYDALIFTDPGGGDNAILVRSDVPHGTGYDIEHGGLAWWFTKRGSKTWGRAHVTVKIPGLRLVVVHTPPSVNWINKLPVGPALRVRVFLAMMRSLRAAIFGWKKTEPDDGLLVVLDANEPPTSKGEDSPRDVAEDTGLEIFPGHGIDWSMGRNVEVSTRVIRVGREGNTADHAQLDMTVTVQAPAHAPAPAPTPTPVPVPTPAPTPPQEAPVARSQNGFSANDRSVVSTRQVPGTDVRLAVRQGVGGDVLIEVARYFDQNVEPISTGRGTLDDWGYAPRNIRGGLKLSNHASGTAIDLNALKHGLGRRGTFTARQKLVMHELLADLDGVVRWGEDYRLRKDGMHFELMTTDTARLKRALEVLRQANADWQPGHRDLVHRPGRTIMFGDDVRLAQRKVGIGNPDGYYGPVTAAKVKAWEKQRNASGHRPMLKVDGIVGTGTWLAMGVEPKYKG